jgi:hypothetical protein
MTGTFLADGAHAIIIESAIPDKRAIKTLVFVFIVIWI